MTLVTTFRLGSLTCHTLDGGRQRLDGGAMFGVVPKPLWEKRITPDERNRIPLGLRCLLIEHDAGPVLVDTGIGNKESAKFLDIYGVENAGTQGPTQLDDALAEVGFVPASIMRAATRSRRPRKARRTLPSRAPRMSFSGESSISPA
jgi:hypothetical protein